MDSIEEPNDGDELRLMRVNDVDLKAADTNAVDHRESNEEDEVPTAKSQVSAQSLAESKGDDDDDDAEKTEKAEKTEDGDKDGDKADSNSTKDGNATSNSTTTANFLTNKNFDGKYGFKENDNIEESPVYRKEMDKVLGKTKKMKQKRGYYGYGYYGNGGQGSNKYDGAQMDVFED